MRATRYGVFLRPDPVTCWVQAQLNTVLVQQFGIVSAAAFPPHATLVGNLRTDLSVDELVALLDPVLSDVAPFTVHNTGLVRGSTAFLYDVHTDGAGQPNAALVAVADAVREAVLPVSLPITDRYVTPVEEATFWGHLSVASHDLLVRPDLAAEVGAFLAGLPLVAPATFTARVWTLFSFEADWDSEWWHTMTWRHLHSWTSGTDGQG